MGEVNQTSVYLTEEDRRIMALLQERTGLNRSALMRLAIHRMYNEDEGRQKRLLQIAEEIRVLA